MERASSRFGVQQRSTGRTALAPSTAESVLVQLWFRNGPGHDRVQGGGGAEASRRRARYDTRTAVDGARREERSARAARRVRAGTWSLPTLFADADPPLTCIFYLYISHWELREALLDILLHRSTIILDRISHQKTA